MATKSFYQTMAIDTPEAGADLAKAFKRYDEHGPYIPGPTKGTTDNPEILEKLRKTGNKQIIPIDFVPIEN